MKYNKQPLDIPAQIAMLKGRGLNIADEQAAEMQNDVNWYSVLLARSRLSSALR